MRNRREIKPSDLFQAIRNESDENIIHLISNNLNVASHAFSFGKSNKNNVNLL